MFKKIILLNIFFLTFFFIKISIANITIIATIDDEIITNYDLKKESDYLKILNPNLTQLNDKQILNLARTSIVNEIIKKREIKKFIDLNSKNLFVDQFLKNLYSKLNLNNEEEFRILLKEKNSFTLNEIKEKIKIELFWNELIYQKYKDQLKIDKEAIIKKVDNLKNDKQKEYLLSEIVFVKKKDLSLKNLINQIQLSINEIGFNNTANIYSISESSRLGGKLGWIKESSLSKPILEKLKLIEENKYTDIIKLGNNYLILKIEKIKINKIKIDKKKEVENLIQIEKNKQLNQFSKIYFNKSKINYSINEK
tara:strand:- start:434 stop:1363 length:930 start_codon:yes stop_codon:yes gene_type:complete